jgi:GAF domain-containing protein
VHPNDSERVKVLRAVGVLDTPADPRFESIIELLCSVFDMPIASVSLIDSERQWFKAIKGMGGDLSRECDRCLSFCAWTLLPAFPTMLVVEDTLEDARFSHSPLVMGEPRLRFYAGAPLVSSVDGYRYGALCVLDTKPRRDFTPERCNLLAQFAELVVREIEKDKVEPFAFFFP